MALLSTPTFLGATTANTRRQLANASVYIRAKKRPADADLSHVALIRTGN